MVDDIIDSMDMSLNELRELVMDCLACRSPWGRKESDTTEDWIESVDPASLCGT